MTRTVRYLMVLGFAGTLSACSSVCPEGGAHCEDPGADPDKVPGDPPLVSADGCQSFGDTLNDYAQFLPDEKRNNPDAGDLSYIYLTSHQAVVISGPTVASGPRPLQLIGPSIFLATSQDGSADGYNVVANENLGYAISIDDFEYELTLARVELCEQGGQVNSRFIFAASGVADGVAHDLRITSVVDGTRRDTSPPYTIEVR